MKVWDRVFRLLCKGECKTSFTQLLPNMLPRKHYCAAEVEEVLHAEETGLPMSQLRTQADESTVRRWRNEFSTVLDKNRMINPQIPIVHFFMVNSPFSPDAVRTSPPELSS